MSSTNRSKRAGQGADYYVTPVEAIETFLIEFKNDWDKVVNPIAFPSQKTIRILDPAAGGDSCNGMSYPAALSKVPLWVHEEIHTLDVRQDSQAQMKCSYFDDWAYDMPSIGGYHVIITNPPFHLAMEFILHSLNGKHLAFGGLVIMLLRLNFFGSDKRYEFFQQHRPVACYVHSKRMGFWPEEVSPEMIEWCKANDVQVQKHGATDSVEYMTAVWQQGINPEFTKLRVI